jgi:two-component system nitrate/nitrite response regulator NarL
MCDAPLVGLSVLIVDDHAAFRSFARALLESHGFRIVGEAADAASALDAAAHLLPDVVLLDVQLPDGDGFAVAERLAGGPDPPRVVLVSSRAASAYRRRLEQTHARGFIPKDELTGERLAALLT